MFKNIFIKFLNKNKKKINLLNYYKIILQLFVHIICIEKCKNK